MTLCFNCLKDPEVRGIDMLFFKVKMEFKLKTRFFTHRIFLQFEAFKTVKIQRKYNCLRLICEFQRSTFIHYVYRFT